MKRLTAMTLVPVFACALILCACGNGSGDTDDGQPPDVATGEDTAVPEDTTVPGDTVIPGDVAADTENDVGGHDIAPEDAADTAAGDEGTDIEPGDAAQDTGDAGPLDPTWTMAACPTGPGVNHAMPWVSEFDLGGAMNTNGWDMIAPQSSVTGLWDVASSDGYFGKTGGRYAVFSGYKGGTATRTGLYSDCVDTSFCAASGSMTVQWRMQYLHADPEKSVTINLVAVTGTDLDAGEIVWTRTVSEDIPYGLFSVNVTGTPATTDGVRFALVLEFPDESVAVAHTWSIDHFVMACGKPNVNVKTLMYACPAGDTECDLTNATQIGDAIPAGTPASIAIGYCDKALLVLCGYDEDATAMNWQMYGFPAIMRDTLPSVQAGTILPALNVGTVNGCETLPQQVALVCGTPAVETPGYFYCASKFSVDCDGNWAGKWDTGVIIRDELDPTDAAPLHSPLESRLPLAVDASIPPE